MDRPEAEGEEPEGGEAGELRKEKEKGEKERNGKSEVQLGGDQDTERSAAPAATLLCLGFIREALHGNAAAE